MQIKDLKELKQFLKLCREMGASDVKADGMEFHLAPLAPKPVRTYRAPRESTDTLETAKITVPSFSPGQKPDETPEQAREKYNKRKAKEKNVLAQQVEQEIETPDELTDEEKLFYSVDGLGDGQ